ncbi:unnamed protein product [Phaedon cochleariae]|uniref:TOG domain-containing protein n=1 Tax=Phaedon cochleariae TaxID=80249 RepID=A0A9P0DNT0_PHACE|nr:unnamed protein product [Phaedon cochleariae]
MLLCRLFALRPISLDNFVLDENGNGNQPVWAVDSSVFQRNGYAKDNNKNPSTVLQPVYILRQDSRRHPQQYGRGERGRSFSPPKQRRSAATPRPAVVFEGFRKSFSSEQLLAGRERTRSRDRSDRSSTSSTGSSTKSGVWQKEIKSGIPIPISSDTKLRFRTSNITANHTSVGPVIARIRNLESPRDDPIITRLSPRDRKPAETQTLHFPPSSGSESSGYFTPPYSTNEEAFVKLEDVQDSQNHGEETTFDSVDKEEVTESDTNNNSQGYANSCEDEVDEARKTPQIYSKPSTPDSLTIENLSTDTQNDDEILKVSTPTNREDLSGSRSPPSFVLNFPGPTTPSLSRKSSPLIENRRKSSSVIDLHNFLPEISSRKNSAPLQKEDVSASRQFLITNAVDIPSPGKISTKSSEPKSDYEELQPPKLPEEPTTRKLSKRLARTSSRKSIKSTPRSVRAPTPTPTTARSEPKEDLQMALTQMNDPEWEVMIRGLQGVARIARQHPEAVEARMHNVCVNLGRHIKNLRSQVARAACYTATEMFGACRKGLEMELEEIAGPLLHRTADTNKFLRADANAALDLMCLQLPQGRVISVLTARGCNHQNSVVRSTGIRLLADLVKRSGPERIFHLQKECRDKIFLAGAKALVDGSLEARNYGKVMFSYLIGCQQFQRCLLEAVPQSTLRHVAKTLNSIKPFETNGC